MDIEYLLWLQNLRESFGGVTLMNLITAIPKSPLSALIPGILFWCVNRRAGLFLMFLASFGRLVNTLIKDTACVYRPWILDSQVQPVSEALTKASSYSMPSGHTQGATAIYGGLAYFYRKKFPQLIIPCTVIILLVGISRNFLGVHTPQDVIVAIVETLAVMVVAEKIFDLTHEDRRFSVILFVAGIIFCATAAFYITTKNYPVDFLNGKVIVSPERAVLDSFDSIGSTIGFLIGVVLEKRFVNFTTKVSREIKIQRAITGVIVGGLAMVILYGLKIFGNVFVYEFCKGFLPLLAIIFLAPLAFNFFENGRKFGRSRRVKA